MISTFYLVCNHTATVVTRTRSYGSETSWSIGNCQSEQAYGNHQQYSQECCLYGGDSGIYIVTCLDSYGDGWHGGYLEVNGKKYCEEFRSGRSYTGTYDANKGRIISDVVSFPLISHGLI